MLTFHAFKSEASSKCWWSMIDLHCRYPNHPLFHLDWIRLTTLPFFEAEITIKSCPCCIISENFTLGTFKFEFRLGSECMLVRLQLACHWQGGMGEVRKGQQTKEKKGEGEKNAGGGQLYPRWSAGQEAKWPSAGWLGLTWVRSWRVGGVFCILAPINGRPGGHIWPTTKDKTSTIVNTT